MNLLNKVFNDIDKRFNLILVPSLNEITRYLQKRQISKINRNKANKKGKSERMLSFCVTLKDLNISEQDTDETVFYKIPNTKINFKKKKVLEEEIFRESTHSGNGLNANMPYEDDDDDNDELYVAQDEDNECNMDYSQELTEKILYQKIKKTTNPDLIAFYNHLINEINETYHVSNVFGNQTFFDMLNQNDYKEDKEQIIKYYFRIILFIQEKVEEIIQALIDKITTIPYATRCICTMIDILISRKFPSLPKYFRHSFIGKFLFNKCIFPVLSLENSNGLKTNLFTTIQSDCFKCIISVISNANMCRLFDIYNDVEKTMFNYYLLEIIPILNKFYDQLVDMTLPSQLNEFIEKSSNNSNIKEETSFLFTEDNLENEAKKESEINININNHKKKYDYFKENSDEIFRLKSVCFSEKDIIFITNLLKKNKDAFKNLPNFEKIEKAIKEKEVKNLEEIISKQKENRERRNLENTVGKGYYTLFYNEDNYLLKEFRDKIKFDNKGEKSLDKSPDIPILTRIKDSIKTILRRLNLLNIKQYSYLNFASSNEKFFLAINYTLKDLEGDKFNDNKVPLNWHSKFIVNNLNQLDHEYIENDYEKLYEEIYSEENVLLNKLKTLSPIINARETMNLNCAENAIENLEYQINNLEKAKKLEKVKIFIDNDKTKVYAYISKEHEEISRTKSRIEKSKNNIIVNKYSIEKNNLNHENVIRLTTADKCNHADILSQAEGINDFIFKLKKSQNFENLRIFINDDIKSGKANHKIYMLFEDYKNILNNRLKVDYKDFIKEKNEENEILNKIEDYILQRTYKYIFPLNPLAEDESFYELTKSYDWIPVTYFGIKKYLPQESIQDSISYMKQMEDKAFSINEKMKYFRMILNNINKINEFYCDISGKTADDQTPVYTYIILKSHPKRIISNVNYIKCFTDGKTEVEPVIQLFKNNSLVCITKILEITPKNLNMTLEEFNKRSIEAKKRLSNLN